MVDLQPVIAWEGDCDCPIGRVASDSRSMVSVLAVSSGGGHWEQLMLLRGGFDQFDVTYAVTKPGLAEREGLSAEIIPDFNARQPFKTLVGAFKIAFLVVKRRPQVVITTGAAPGVTALAVGKMIGARTIWIDSIANAQRMSLSGRIARPLADLWLTQWEHLAGPRGPHFAGAVF